MSYLVRLTVTVVKIYIMPQMKAVFFLAGKLTCEKRYVWFGIGIHREAQAAQSPVQFSTLRRESNAIFVFDRLTNL